MEPFRFCVATMGAELYGFEVDRSFWYQSAIFQHRLLKWLQIILSIFVTNFDPQGPTIHQNKGNFKRVSGSPLDLVQLLWLLSYIDLKQSGRHRLLVYVVLRIFRRFRRIFPFLYVSNQMIFQMISNLRTFWILLQTSTSPLESAGRISLSFANKSFDQNRSKLPYQ